MNKVVSVGVSAVFVMLAVWHFRMALLPSSSKVGAVPSVEGKPLFLPSPRATVGVGIILLLFAVLIAATSGLVSVGLPTYVLHWLCYALSLGLLARAVGEFKYIGFFKRVRGSRFATLDTLMYSPLCFLLAVGVAFVAHHNGS